MKKLTFIFFIFCMLLNAEAAKVQRIEPLNWWVGMKNPNLQILIYGQDLSTLVPEISYPGVKLNSILRPTNKNYLFLNLEIAPETKAGNVDIKLKSNGKLVESISYQLKEREKGSADREGFNSGDVIYQIMPDRFVNGDSTNDIVKGYPDVLNRSTPNERHGGDIQGIINQLDYISSMGYTALWLTPVLENNMPGYSYHGYAITDFYKVDPRHGSNELYRKLTDECKKRGIKMIIDIIVNHCGTEWWLYKDLPSNDWLNFYPDIKTCNFRGTTVFDPYSSDVDLKGMTDGWFSTGMPDLNQRNPLVATYLIQNSIWWIEYAGLGGIRSDTHQYPDKVFVSEWAKQIMNEYPNFNIVGEVWLGSTSMVAYWQKDAFNKDGYNSNLPTIMDFPQTFALPNAFSDAKNSAGVNSIYELLSQDFLIANPMNVMTFADNHDVSRFYTTMGENLPNFKLAMAFLLTSRGIPQMYSGTEILMTGDKQEGDGKMRKDFPGGWTNDKINGFTQSGLSKDQIEAQNFLKTIQNWRKSNDAVKYGSLKHFYPMDEVYVYFRKKGDKSVMILLNNSKNDQNVATARYIECLRGHNSGTEVITGSKVTIGDKIQIKSKTAMIIDLD